MTYSPNKPDPGPSPAIDVSQIQTNFSQFANIFSTLIGGISYNHTPLNNPNQGDHESVILTNQAADPGVMQNLAVLYAKNAISRGSPSPGQPQLFVQIPKFLPNEFDTTPAPNAGMQLTFNSVSTAAPVYQSFLAGGYLFYFGSVTDVTVPVILSPAPTLLLAAVATSNNLIPEPQFTPYDARVVINTTTNDRFMILSTDAVIIGPPYSFGWWAVGKA